MALGEVTLPIAVSRIFSEEELEAALTIAAEGKSVGDGPYASKLKKKKNRKGEQVEVDEGEDTARGLANNLRQHMMIRAEDADGASKYAVSRGEGRRAGTTLRTKVWEDTDGWYYAVYEAEVLDTENGSAPVGDDGEDE